jgi:DNA-directed RNA polymerase subunit RPC12/RpoP
MRPTYRCFACGRDFDVAISVMKDHLRSGGHQCAKCPKVTRSILKRLHVLYPDEVPMPEGKSI